MCEQQKHPPKRLNHADIDAVQRSASLSFDTKTSSFGNQIQPQSLARPGAASKYQTQVAVATMDHARPIAPRGRVEWTVTDAFRTATLLRPNTGSGLGLPHRVERKAQLNQQSTPSRLKQFDVQHTLRPSMRYGHANGLRP